MHATSHRLTIIVAAFVALLTLFGTMGAAASPVIEDDPGSTVELSQAGMAYQLVDAVFNHRDADAASALIADNAVIHTDLGDFTGPQGLIEYIDQVRSSYPDAHFELTSISVTDTGITLEWTMFATYFVFDPAYDAIRMTTKIPTAATVTVKDGQIASVTESTAEVATAPQRSVAANYGPTA